MSRDFEPHRPHWRSQCLNRAALSLFWLGSDAYEHNSYAKDWSFALNDMSSVQYRGPWQCPFHVKFRAIEVCGGSDFQSTYAWSPPRNSRHHKYSDSAPLYFYYDGQMMNQTPAGAPPGSHRLSPLSMYVFLGIFQGTHQNVVRSRDQMIDWRPMGFHESGDGSSWVSFAGGQNRLCVESPDRPRWVKELLPQAYRSEIRHSQHHFGGGMHGDLSVILGLIAFSVPFDELPFVLPRCFSGGHWRGIYPEEPGWGWQDHRGLMVEVSLHATNLQFLGPLQDGAYGQLFS